MLKNIYLPILRWILLDFNSSRETLESYDVSNMYRFIIGTRSHDPYLNKSAPLFAERLMLAVPKDHPLVQRDRVFVSELKNVYFVLQAKNKNYAKTLVQYCRDHGFEPQVRLSKKLTSLFKRSQFFYIKKELPPHGLYMP